MFTGIVETLGKLENLREEGTNLVFTFSSAITSELKVDQSLSHDGVCLTVSKLTNEAYEVVAIEETLRKTNLTLLKIGDKVNLERCMLANGRYDGHIVQGHIDQTAVCESVLESNGSYVYTFRYSNSLGNFTVEKGSIAVNGVSLTVFDSRPGAFRVAIIPYTFEHTNFPNVRAGSVVNLEFDILGKYLKQLFQNQQQ